MLDYKSDVLHKDKGVEIRLLESTQSPHYIPKVNNLSFLNEAEIFRAYILENKINDLKQILSQQQSYELFLQQKGRRPIYDIYACFQPFNEATKALMPFLKALQKTVKPNDVILNLWDRTGWLANLLAGLFPEQKIVTTWEGNKDVLGYKGFFFWMQHQENVEVLFCDMNAPLPFADDSIAFSVGLDFVHRCNQSFMFQELMRVVRDEGAILFPHVHLSNNEPIPYFDRGGKQIHGEEYAQAFKKYAETTNWEGYVFSEPTLFSYNDIQQSSSIPLISTPSTDDYNGLLAFLPKSWKDSSLSAFTIEDVKDIDNAYVLINQLLNINLHQQIVIVDNDYLDGAVGKLLERHPVYYERIQALNHYRLSDLECKVIYLAQNGSTVKEIYTALNIEQKELLTILRAFEQLGLLQVLPISNDAFRLQSYLMTQQYIFPKQQQNLQFLWQKTIQSFPNNVLLHSVKDESEFTYEECAEVVDSIILALQNSALKKGDRVIICSKIHTEAILLTWACLQIGVVVIPINADLSDNDIQYIKEETNAKYYFLSEHVYKSKGECFDLEHTIVFDEDERAFEEVNYFSDWLEVEEEEDIEMPVIDSKDAAVILFTSGSTGRPKGVQLSHGNLFRSGRLITETFHWKVNDKFLALGSLDAMSGLRNTIVAPLHIGASIVVPDANAISNLFYITETISDAQTTILGGNPALLHQLVKFTKKIRGQLNSLKTVICTGNYLSNELRTAFKEAYNLSIYNYYGLTETTGICTSQGPLDEVLNNGSIGKPIACIAQIVDEDENVVPVGEQGELRIYSQNLMTGYLNKDELTKGVIRDNWFYTQDIAMFTEEGNIQLLGRKRNIIKTSTEELIYLSEIQDFISQMEFVEDVAVSTYYKEDIEKMAAFVVLKDSLQLSHIIIKNQIRASIEESLGSKKVPNQIVFLTKLPYTESGKLIKKQLLNELH